MKPWGDGSHNVWMAGETLEASPKVWRLQNLVFRTISRRLGTNTFHRDSSLVDALAILVILTAFTEGWDVAKKHCRFLTYLTTFQLREMYHWSQDAFINAASLDPFQFVLHKAVPAYYSSCEFMIINALNMMRSAVYDKLSKYGTGRALEEYMDRQTAADFAGVHGHKMLAIANCAALVGSKDVAIGPRVLEVS